MSLPPEEDLLSQFKDTYNPVIRQDKGFDYYFRKVHLRGARYVEVSKMDGSRFVTMYWITKHRGELYCNCPAGRRGILCKHRKWLNEIKWPDGKEA